MPFEICDHLCPLLLKVLRQMGIYCTMTHYFGRIFRHISPNSYSNSIAGIREKFLLIPSTLIKGNRRGTVFSAERRKGTATDVRNTLTHSARTIIKEFDSGMLWQRACRSQRFRAFFPLFSSKGCFLRGVPKPLLLQIRSQAVNRVPRAPHSHLLSLPIPRRIIGGGMVTHAVRHALQAPPLNLQCITQST
jgi:hypothetical protein